MAPPQPRILWSAPATPSLVHSPYEGGQSEDGIAMSSVDVEKLLPYFQLAIPLVNQVSLPFSFG